MPLTGDEAIRQRLIELLRSFAQVDPNVVLLFSLRYAWNINTMS